MASEKGDATIYFYHTQDIQYVLRMYAKHEFPSHFLYGALHLEEHGIHVIWHKSIANTKPRWRQMLHNLWQVLLNYHRFDAVYATHYRGFELIIFLRALGLFRKPIVLWHHQPVVKPRNAVRNWLGKFFYHGIDRMVFFSQKLIDDSLKTGKVPAYKLVLGHWGSDLDMYDALLTENTEGIVERRGFVSTGKELRDFPTLVTAFNETGLPVDIFTNKKNGECDYQQIFDSLNVNSNVRVHFFQGLLPFDLAREVNKAKCVVICCQESKYTVGLTTVVEALALGLPIICSRNPQMPFDLEKDGIGISVPYYDVEGWKSAIRYIDTHPHEAEEMGKRGRLLATKHFNDRHCAAEIAELIKSVLRK